MVLLSCLRLAEDRNKRRGENVEQATAEDSVALDCRQQPAQPVLRRTGPGAWDALRPGP